MPSPPPWETQPHRQHFQLEIITPSYPRQWPGSAGWGKCGSLDVPSVPQELVSKLLHLHFKDKKTKGVWARGRGGVGPHTTGLRSQGLREGWVDQTEGGGHQPELEPSPKG